MKVLELASCPACGASAFRDFDLGEGNLLRRCDRCATVFAACYADPSEVYVDGYMFGQAGRFGGDVRAPGFQRYLARVARRRIQMIEQATKLRGGSLLDVGSGTGEVLMGARDGGWSAHGVEPEPTGAEMAQGRGPDVQIALLEDAGLPERSYDVVSAFHVLEHAITGRNLRPLEHLVHFTPETLARTMRSAGIEPVLIRSPVYVGRPQTLDHALNDLVRHGRFRRVVEPLSPVRGVNGDRARYPSRAGWALLNATEAVHDRAGVGTGVFCVGAVR